MMFSDSLKTTLTARLQTLPAFISAPNLRRDLDDLLPKARLAVIDDINTSTAYGDLAARALKATHITLARGVKPDAESVAEIEYKSKHADMLVAVGSGTINDLVKAAAFNAKKPYALIPTAASMNGYVSQNASIEKDGHKTSIACALPQLVLIDWQLIREAPARLSQAGLGDSLARPTAQADWLFAHHLLGVAYDDFPFQLTSVYEQAAFEQAVAITRGDGQAIEALLMLLFAAGFGMTAAGSSTPASGAEHMITHIMSREGNLHGEEIAVTSVDMAIRQASLLKTNTPPHLLDTHEDKQALYPKGGITKLAWDKAREAISDIHITPEKLSQIRNNAGLPDSALKLGWDVEKYAEAIATARFTRDRFTCLELQA